MHTAEDKCDSRNAQSDGPSVIGRFTWAIVGKACVPCLLKNDNTKYVSVRMAELEVLGHFLHKLNTEVFNCVSVKSFGITEAENKLLNDINSKHCDFAFGKEPFTSNNDFIVKLDDLMEFYDFMNVCYTKLLLPNSAGDQNSNRCGFLRINDDSVVPYATKNNQKYVPLFYFEGETDSLKTKAINLESWDLAYLKFCCKVQGIKNELFASEKCLVTSLEDVKSYFPEGTKFDDYWPSKIVEMQPSNRALVYGNHSWVQTPHVVSSSTIPSQSSVPNSKGIVSRHPNSNQRVNSTSVITNLSSNGSIYQNSMWPSTLMGNSTIISTSGTYQPHTTNQPRPAHKLNSISMNSMNSNSIIRHRTHSNQTVRSQQPQYFMSNVPNVSGTTQQSSLERVSAVNSLSTGYGNAVCSDAYSSHTSQSSSQQLTNILSGLSRSKSNITPTSQQQVKSRTSVSNQVVNSTVARYPPALTPINGASSVIHVAGNSNSLSNLPNNVNNAIAASNGPQHHRPNLIQSGGEIIDLSSPPHSPLPMNNLMNGMSSVSSGSYNLNTNNNPSLPPLERIDSPQLMKNGIPQYKVETIKLFNKSVPAINFKPYSDAAYAISLQDIITYYFPHVEMNKLRNWLQNVLSINLYEANSAQVQCLRECYKNKVVTGDLPLLRTQDFESNYPRIAYLYERDMGVDRDAKRQKVS